MARATVEIVEQVARLAKLSLTAEEKLLFARQLDEILGYAQSIASLDLEAATPMSHAATSETFRDDRVADGLTHGAATDAAPDAAEGLFRVPRILG